MLCRSMNDPWKAASRVMMITFGYGTGLSINKFNITEMFGQTRSATHLDKSRANTVLYIRVSAVI